MIKLMKWLWIRSLHFSAFMTLGLWVTSPVQAACTLVSGSAAPTHFSTMPISMSVPAHAGATNGYLIWGGSQRLNSSNDAVISCDGGYPDTGNITSALKGNDGRLETGVPGVTLQVNFEDSPLGLGYFSGGPAPGRVTHINDYSKCSKLQPCVTPVGYIGRLDVRVWAEKGVVGAGNSGLLTIGSLTFGSAVFPITIDPIVIAPSSCIVRTENQNFTVTMPKISQSDLLSEGSAAGETPFKIQLDCPGTKMDAYGDSSTGIFKPYGGFPSINISFGDLGTPDPLHPDKLSLTSDSTASGVMYQLLSSSTVLAPGTKKRLRNADTTAIELPFSVRYVRTGPVKAGSAKAIATFTLTYE